jgi:hypothetical protein
MRRLPALVAGLWLAAASAGAAAYEPRLLLDAPLLPEGSATSVATVVALDNVGDPLVVDLGRPVRFRGLLLQADGNDVYWVESSADGQAWTPVWRVPTAYGAPGLRTRTKTLDAQVEARFVRVRATAGDGVFAVARLRLYPEPPRPWPPVLDRGLANGPLPAWPLLTPAQTATLQAGVAVLGLLAALMARAGARRSRALLGLAAVLAAAAWVNFGNFRYHTVAHTWELYHYYVGAKYFPELGYDHLYDCSALAESEDDGPAALGERRLRDLATNRIVFASDVLAHPETCHARFSADRWSAFRADVRAFRGMRPSDWAEVQLDHGYNATPVWTLTGRLIANRVAPTPTGIAILVSFDFALILLGLALLFAGFGFEAGCLAVIFFGASTFSRFSWTGGAFLRYDWFFWSMAGVWALRRERHGLAGFALTYAALLRVFPGVLLLGLVLQAAGRLVLDRRRATLSHLRSLVLGGALAGLLLIPASAAVTGGLDAWPAFVANSRKYLVTEATNRLGLATALAYRHELRQELAFDPLRPDGFEAWSQGQAQTLAGRRFWLVALEGAYLALFAWGCARHKPWVAAALGAGLLPILLRMANYYYGLLAVCAALAALHPGFGIALALLAWTSHIATDLFPAYDQRAAALSALAVAFAFWTAARIARLDPRDAPGADPTP